MPSNEYNEKVNEIISGKCNKRTGVIRSPRRIAALIIATMIIASLTITAVAFRKQLKSFFVDVFDSFTRLTVTPEEDAPKTIEEVYTIPNLPDGFTIISETVEEKIAQTLWFCDYAMLCLEQSIIGTTIGMDTENGEYEKIEVNGFEGHKTYKDGMYTLTWIDERYVFCIICQDTAYAPRSQRNSA